ncbi:snRNA-activating protein of 50kDa MW C terminal-domain-containing protein [Umbelopsis sp. AD052]|nr:snRNA-activating protein of 50kDa MW C terminal-domain-containing protein [Umbelopsis sp. AD052]
MPGRLLDEEDEAKDILDPHVPKKRQYLASNRMPAILFNSKKARLQSNESDNHSTESASVNDADMPSNILENSPYPLSELDSEGLTPMNLEMESPSASATPLALPPTSSRPITYVAPVDTPNQDDDRTLSEDDSENEQEEGNEGDQSDGEAEGNSLEAPPDDPRIAKTTLETRYLEMANLLDTSVLATLNPSNRFSVSGSQALQPNFLVADEGGALSTKVNKKPVKVRDNEIVLSVAIYQEKRPSRKLQEFTVLGSQTLAALRDVITCGSDIWMESPSQASQASQVRQARAAGQQNEPREPGLTMTEVVRQRAKKRQYPSYFFINKCFYSDTRHPEVKNRVDDPCDDIIKWINENERCNQQHLAGVSKKSMQSVKFQDLEIQLNYPYLFCHQDVCKHILVFKDIWLHGQRDEIDATAYPLLTYQCRMARSKCHMCQYWPAEFVTLNDVVSGYSPCFFCSRCYVPFHYDKQGKKLWDHEVRTYAL